jgi:branched-chain amino acid transport system ATP-binding protein
LAPSALALVDVDAFYGDSHVLHKISFALGEGRLLGLLGRNGAGKSTCMNVAVGLLPARGGAIEVFGKPLTNASPEAIAGRGVALVPQGRRVFRSLTVRENLAVAAAKPAGGAGEPWTADRVFAMFPRLGERRHQLAASLSGGEQQMLAIGRALMRNPRVLLMDEPSEGLAPNIVADVGRTIGRLKAVGLSIVLVEQNIKLALELADDVVVINTGAVAFQGTPAALKADEAAIAQHLGVF